MARVTRAFLKSITGILSPRGNRKEESLSPPAAPAPRRVALEVEAHDFGTLEGVVEATLDLTEAKLDGARELAAILEKLGVPAGAVAVSRISAAADRETLAELRAEHARLKLKRAHKRFDATLEKEVGHIKINA